MTARAERDASHSLSQIREKFLKDTFGERVGWWANEAVDLFDSVTPALEFIDRRRRNQPFGLQDLVLLVAAVPGPQNAAVRAAAKAAGKVSKAKFTIMGLDRERYLELLRNPPLGLPAPKAIESARRKKYRGVASHGGKLPRIKPGESWPKGSHGNAGKVPAQVAEKLNGAKISSFGHLRKKFWREVAADPVLSKQFTGENAERISKGKAPHADETQRLGKRPPLEIDHHQPLTDNGNVYDMDNMVVRSSLNHVKGK